jgi:hypothetical protein
MSQSALTPEQVRLIRIFYPHAIERQEKAKNKRFVHYTNAEATLNILRTKRIWMRKSSCMNDFMEIEHGLNCLIKAHESQDIGKDFKKTLDSIFPKLSQRVADLFNSWVPHIKYDTYFSCFSEHSDDEDLTGRLSMWRAYGNATGVAFVLDSGPFLRPSGALKAYTSPVAYLNDKLFREEFSRITKAIQENIDFIKLHGEDSLLSNIFQMFTLAITCTKHPGFREEQEWRIIYTPPLRSSNHLESEIVSIGNVPQQIYKIPLKNIPDEGLFGVEPNELVDRVIIGPTLYPSAIQQAFIKLMTGAGIQDAAEKVIISDIPLRR